MQDDQTPQTSPAPQTDNNAQDNGAPAATPAPDGVSQTGQQSTAEEQNAVNQQVNDFVASAPAEPAAEQSNPSGDSSSLGGPQVPPTSAPGQEDSSPSGNQPGTPSGL